MIHARIAVFAVALFTTEVFAGGLQVRSSDAFLLRNGIQTYSFSRSGDRIDVAMNVAGAPASMAIEVPEGRLKIGYSTSADEHFEATWDIASGRFAFVDTAGAIHSRQFNFDTQYWETSSEDANAFAAYETELRTMTAVVADLESHDVLSTVGAVTGARDGGNVVRSFRPRQLRRIEGLRVPTYVPPPTGGGGGGSCSGYTVRGTSSGSAQSYACDGARSDANLQCWNQWCTGCCAFGDCDSMCAIGDYICYAGVSGQACGYSDVPH